MKQYVIINNSLKMSKGKIARVCLMLGYKSYYLMKGKYLSLASWIENRRIAYIKKTDNYDIIKEKLKLENIKFEEHVDAGLTQVPSGSSCGLVFFTNKELDFINELKLV